MKYVGVDGCKGGWLAISLGESEHEGIEWSLFETFAQLWSNCNDAQYLFVDIPVGLAGAGTREADQEARRALSSCLKSSIFNTPVRKAVYAATKAEAKSINQKLSGKSLSEQSLGIMKKILEVDRFIQAHAEGRVKIFESHPEVCFGALAGQPLSYGKKDLLGGLERLKIIRNFVPNAEEILVSVRKMHVRSKVEGDDVLDACILALTARECKGNPMFFPAGRSEPPRDETGLPMAIWYHACSTPILRDL